MNTQMDKDCYYMDMALDKAREAYKIGEIPIGAIIVKDDEIISSAYNMREIDKNALAHAEILAIRDACKRLDSWRLTGCTMYVTIEPCPMCAGALVMSRIDRLVYGSADYKAGAIESLFNIAQNQSLNHQIEVKAGVRALECSDLMKDFFREKRNK